MEKKRNIKEKARLVFIREKASQAKEKSRHKHLVPGPFTVIDGARGIEHHDPEPEENSSAIDRIDHKTISTLSRAEMAVRYARHQQQRNASHRETHSEPEPEAAPEAGENNAEMRLTMRRISKPASPQDLMREEAVRDYKAKQRQKEYATSTPEAETLHSPEKADRPYRKTRETAPARRSSRQQSSWHKQAPRPKAQTYREQGRRLARGTAIKETVQKHSRRDRRLRKLKAAVERAARASTRSALAAGGLLLLILPLLLLFGAVGALFGSSGDWEKAPVSDEVKAYAGLIQLYAAEHGIPEYTELIMAVMMQESGGQGKDPMQASESAYNTRYPNGPGGITDPEYSINVGIQALADVITRAGVNSPIDIENICLALQGYNFGPGYISWALNHYGGYSKENALEFSQLMAAQLGWTSYGDAQYADHVLRYYPMSGAVLGGNSALAYVAASQVGSTGGQTYWSWYGYNYRVEWCACFVSWCASQCGVLDIDIPKFAYCPSGVEWFKDKGAWQDRYYTPSPGDIIFFDWLMDGARDGLADHVGMVERIEDNIVYTIEGNVNDRCVHGQYHLGAAEILGYWITQ